MVRSWGMILFSVMLAACAKDEDKVDDQGGLEGKYIGTFTRTGMDTASVTIDFDGNGFQGQSDRAKYPAICTGSLQLAGSTITFTDSCAWTADFDWTLILDGAYTLDEEENTLRISRNNGAVMDEYILRRLTR